MGSIFGPIVQFQTWHLLKQVVVSEIMDLQIWKKYVGSRIAAIVRFMKHEYQPCSMILNSYETSIND